MLLPCLSCFEKQSINSSSAALCRASVLKTQDSRSTAAIPHGFTPTEGGMDGGLSRLTSVEVAVPTGRDLMPVRSNTFQVDDAWKRMMHMAQRKSRCRHLEPRFKGMLQTTHSPQFNSVSKGCTIVPSEAFRLLTLDLLRYHQSRGRSIHELVAIRSVRRSSIGCRLSR